VRARLAGPGMRFLPVVAASVAMGCIVITPLEDYPEKSAGQGGAHSGGAGGGAGKTSGGGSGGVPEAGTDAAACATNKECVDRGAGEPYRCRPSDHTCVALPTDECPLVYGTPEDPNAIFVGAFATLSPTVPEDNAIVWAHRLALEELSGDNVGGLPGGPGGARRPLVMVVCNNDTTVVDAALSHLADDIEVPALLATLQPGDLRRGFEAHRDKHMFFLSPVGATRTLVDYADDGLLWNMLGQPSDLAPAYGALLGLAERYVVGYRGVNGRPLRVALVTTTEAFDAELANFVAPVLRFNGKSQSENETLGNYKGFTVDLANPQLDQTGLSIVDFRPDIVVSAAGEPFSQSSGVLESIEAGWADPTAPDAGTQGRPFYILSPFNAGNLQGISDLIRGFVQSALDPTANRRFVGVAAAGAKDPTLQNAYATRLRTRFPNAYTDSGNYYDAFYFLAYAMYGAGSVAPLTGPDIATGMRRLLGGKAFAVGPTSISAVFTALEPPAATIELDGTLGPPNFDPTTGVRIDDGSVLCFDNQQGLIGLHTEVLRYDRGLQGFVGTFPCFSGFYP
jgi:hypothetical protein